MPLQCETIVFEGPGVSNFQDIRCFFGDQSKETLFIDFEIILGGSGTPFRALLVSFVLLVFEDSLEALFREGAAGSTTPSATTGRVHDARMLDRMCP